MTIGRTMMLRGVERGRKLVSCFVAKVKTVTLLSALCSYASAGAGRTELKHRRGRSPLARPQLHPIKHDWDTVRPLFSHIQGRTKGSRRLTRRPSPRSQHKKRKNAPVLLSNAFSRTLDKFSAKICKSYVKQLYLWGRRIWRKSLYVSCQKFMVEKISEKSAWRKCRRDCGGIYSTEWESSPRDLRPSKEPILYDSRKRLRARQDDNGNQFYSILL